jgi:Ni/Co efflux regulator RcnB
VHRGDHADRDDLFYLDDYPRYGLPSLPYGQRYAVVDDQIVVIDAETYEVLQLIRLFSALAN